MIVLAVGGYAYAGKDAFVDALEQQFEYQRTFMSKPLMNALLELNPMIPLSLLENQMLFSIDEAVRYKLLHEIVGYDDSKKEPEVRRLLQILGTEVGRRMFGENVWIDQITDEILAGDGEFWAVTGTRYDNELAGLQVLDAISVWIDRPGITPVNAHSSDNTLGPEDFDHVIDNSGTLDDLAKVAAAFHKKYMVAAHHQKRDQPLFEKTTTTSK